ncbi:MAG: hypothetical protein JNN00_01325 [Chitinophagaceae bacterium]|nr:hypothetical protein [Chitinophagaceae bacterium]
MAIKITLFITLVLYAVVISQAFFYLLAMSNVTKNLQPAAYIESRHLLDKNLQQTLKTVYYLTLSSSILLVSFCVTNPSGWLFICSVIALLSLVADIVLTLKGNVPLNKIINTWTLSDYPADWKDYRAKWLSIYHIRQVVNIIGFISLLTGFIFGM